MTTATNAWVGACIGGCSGEGKEVLGGEFGGKLIAASCSLWNSRLQQTANGCGGIVNEIHSYFTNFIVYLSVNRIENFIIPVVDI